MAFKALILFSRRDGRLVWLGRHGGRHFFSSDWILTRLRRLVFADLHQYHSPWRISMGEHQMINADFDTGEQPQLSRPTTAGRPEMRSLVARLLVQAQLTLSATSWTSPSSSQPTGSERRKRYPCHKRQDSIPVKITQTRSAFLNLLVNDLTIARSPLLLHLHRQGFFKVQLKTSTVGQAEWLAGMTVKSGDGGTDFGGAEGRLLNWTGF
jgi:hypothetical protein